ncbi:MAG: hypothetical protein WC150_08945 [Bacteroidia bacterium]
MKNTLALFSALLITTVAAAQTNPVITGWMQNTTNIKVAIM